MSDNLDYEFFEGWWRPVRDNRPDEKEQLMGCDGQRCIYVTYDDYDTIAKWNGPVEVNAEIWYNAALYDMGEF